MKKSKINYIPILQNYFEHGYSFEWLQGYINAMRETNAITYNQYRRYLKYVNHKFRSLERRMVMLNEGLKRCTDCELYPKSCGYWEKSYRKNNPNLPRKDDNHNCDYFKPKHKI